jgi:hypothetical protein
VRSGTRRWRVIAVAVVFLLLLTVADRVAASLAANALASHIQSAEGLTHKPKVHIGGLPFLAQVAAGSYSDVVLSGVAFNVRVPGYRRHGLFCTESRSASVMWSEDGYAKCL